MRRAATHAQVELRDTNQLVERYCHVNRVRPSNLNYRGGGRERRWVPTLTSTLNRRRENGWCKACIPW